MLEQEFDPKLTKQVLQSLNGNKVSTSITALICALVGIAFQFGVDREVLLSLVGDVYDRRKAQG